MENLIPARKAMEILAIKTRRQLNEIVRQGRLTAIKHARKTVCFRPVDLARYIEQSSTRAA